MAEEGGMFTIRIEHEEVTKEKLKAIKRAKRAAGWMEFSAVMSGVSTAFSNNSLQYMVRSTNTQVAIELTDFYKANANAEQKLNIDMDRQYQRSGTAGERHGARSRLVRPTLPVTSYQNEQS